MSAKEDATTGIITVAIFGVQGAFSASDATAWGAALVTLAPAILVLFLIWRIYKLDKQHSECTANNAKFQEQILLMYRALQDGHVRKQLPPEQAFVENHFNLDDHPTRTN